MYKAEADLLDHYNKYPSYYSSVGSRTLEKLGVVLSEGCSVLDLGCGDGRLATKLPEGVHYLGVDFCPGRIGKADEKNPNHTFVCQDIYEFLESDKGEYDLIAAFEVLEHLVNPQRVVCLGQRRLRQGGVMVGSVPVNMPYVAHLQIFEDGPDVQKKLDPDSLEERDNHFWCKWSKRPE